MFGLFFNFIMSAKIIFYIFILFFLTGCIDYPSEPTLNDFEVFLKEEKSEFKIDKQNENSSVGFDSSLVKDWVELDNGFWFKEMPVSIENHVVDMARVIRIDPNSYSFKILQDTENPKVITQWGKEQNFLFLFNGGYFTETNQAAGGLIINNKQNSLLTLNGENGYTGMLSINYGRLSLRYLPENPLKIESLPESAVQLYPTIIFPNGRAGIKENSEKRARRTIIAKDKEGMIVLIIIPKPVLSLYEVMTFLLESDLSIDEAYNLDGGPSTGLFIRTKNFFYEVPSLPIPLVIGATKN